MILSTQTFGYGNFEGNDQRQNVDFEREETVLQIFLATVILCNFQGGSMRQNFDFGNMNNGFGGFNKFFRLLHSNVILKGDDLRQNGDFERRNLGLQESKRFSHSHGTNTFHYFEIFVM